MLLRCLFVGFGGFAGAVARYLVGQIPLFSRQVFPFATLLINFLGAVAIAVIAEASLRIAPLSPDLLLFLKAGLCGGFTTFSTFSLETMELLENGKTFPALAYILLSVGLCLAGVWLGKAAVLWMAK